MTMISRIEGLDASTPKSLEVYVDNELAAVATPLDSLYFITIQSDQIGDLRFEIDGQTFVPVNGTIHYAADSHYGNLTEPVVLKIDDNRPYKIIEDNHVIIIRNYEKYDVTGKKL